MKESKNVFFAVAVVAVVFGIGIFVNQSGNQGEVKSAEDQNNQAAVETEPETAADKLGPNEIKLTKDNFDKEVLKSDKLVMVDFYLSSCPHCQTVAPIVTDFANSYKDKVKVGKFRVSDAREIATTYNIEGVPTFIFFKAGKEVDRKSGSDGTGDTFKKMADKYLK